MKHQLCFALASIALALPATAQGQIGPDITISKVGDNSSDFPWYGDNGAGTLANYSLATTSCNLGDVPVYWYDYNGGASPGANQHPVIGQNIFRIMDGRIEQLGQSFLKHGFCAVNEPGCTSCQGTNCDTLGIGCNDTYWGTLNDGRSGAAKSDMNANTGYNPYPSVTSPVGGTHRGRLKVEIAKMGNPGAVYVAEGQYLSEHDQLAGNGRNNASWIQINTNNYQNLAQIGGTVMQESAIDAWQALDSGVITNEMVNVDEGGAGVHGWFPFAYKFVDLGGGLWRYEYAVQNLTSDRSGASFSIPVNDSLTVSDVFFNDVDYHSGEPYDNTDWVWNHANNELKWETTTPHSVNPDGNALRWGTLYSFGFTVNSGPTSTTVTLGLFKPGSPNSIQGNARGPSQEADCGSITRFCNPAVPNSTGNSGVMNVTGSLDVGDDNLTLTASNLPTGSNIGYFIMGDGTNTFTPPGSDGPICIGGGGSFLRYLPPTSNTNEGPGSFSRFVGTTGPVSGNITPGSTWNFQAWHRDGMNPSNLTDAVAVEFCP